VNQATPQYLVNLSALALAGFPQVGKMYPAFASGLFLMGEAPQNVKERCIFIGMIGWFGGIR